MGGQISCVVWGGGGGGAGRVPGKAAYPRYRLSVLLSFRRE